jgi:spermidine/putrescine-binding protein
MAHYWIDSNYILLYKKIIKKFTAMKTTIFAIIGGLMLLFATNVEAKKPDVKESNISNYIKNVVSYPSFAEDSKIEGVVNVAIELNEANELQVLQVWGTNPDLVKYVERRVKKMAKKHGPFSDLKDETKLVRVKFNLES